MIPTIERIIEELLAGEITKQQAIGWLHQHAEDACRTLRDDFAAAALQGLMAGRYRYDYMFDATAKQAYEYADAMLKAREQ